MLLPIAGRIKDPSLSLMTKSKWGDEEGCVEMSLNNCCFKREGEEGILEVRKSHIRIVRGHGVTRQFFF